MAPESSMPPDSVVPWTPHQAHEHVKMMREQFREDPGMGTPEQVAALVQIMLEHMACPHADCPLMLLEHEPLRQGGAGL